MQQQKQIIRVFVVWLFILMSCAPFYFLSSTVLRTILDKMPASEMITSPPSKNTSQALFHASSSNVLSKTSLDKMSTSEMITSPFHFCQVPSLTLTGASKPSFNIGYWCSGEPYEDFSRKLQSFTMDKSQGYGTSWGRRKSPLPPNKSILLFGNSHLRQVASSLICQYWAQAQDVIRVVDGSAYTVHFHNNVTIHVITNNPYVYSKNWLDLLESRLIKRPIASLDAIVLGRFNDQSNSQNTSFVKAMQEMSKNMDGVDFNSIEPPHIGNIAQVYNGPIVAVSMFARYAEGQGNKTERIMNILAKGSKGR
jgi:hypothetical protein